MKKKLILCALISLVGFQPITAISERYLPMPPQQEDLEQARRVQRMQEEMSRIDKFYFSRLLWCLGCGVGWGGACYLMNRDKDWVIRNITPMTLAFGLASTAYYYGVKALANRLF